MTKSIEFLLAFRDKITAPMKKINDLKDKINKGAINIKTMPQSITELNKHLEHLIVLRNSKTEGSLLKGLNRQIEETNNKISKLSGTQKGFFANMMSNAKGFIAANVIQNIGSSIWNFGKSAVASFDTAAKANAQLETVLTSTGSASRQTMSSLTAEAERLSKITLFDDDTIKGAQGLMLTFTEVKDKVFTDSIPLIQDMATAMAGDGPADLKGATIQVGKALNDPIKGISALSRVGVTFSESQKNVIKNLTETGRKAEAQQLILAELRKEFGGSAEAAAKAGLGPLQQLGIRFGEITESIGGFILNGLNVLAPAFSGIAGAIEGFISAISTMYMWVKKNKEVLIKIGEVLVVGTGIALAAAIGINALVIAKTIWVSVTGAVTAAMGLLNAVMAVNPIFLVIAGITALVAIFIYLYDTCEEVRGAINALWDGIKFAFINIGKLGMDIFGNLGKIIRGVFTFNGDDIKSGISGLKDSFSSFGAGLSDSMTKGYARGVKEIQDKNATPEGVTALAGKKKPIVDLSGEYGDIDSKSKKSKKQASDKADRVAGDAKNQRNITFNIAEFGSVRIDKIQNMGTDLNNKLASFEEDWRNTLLRIIRNTETAI